MGRARGVGQLGREEHAARLACDHGYLRRTRAHPSVVRISHDAAVQRDGRYGKGVELFVRSVMPQIKAVLRDGGYRYGVPVRRAIGREGEGARSVSVNRLGLCGPKGYRFHVRVSDPVPVTLFGAELGGVETRAA